LPEECNAIDDADVLCASHQLYCCINMIDACDACGFHFQWRFSFDAAVQQAIRLMPRPTPAIYTLLCASRLAEAMPQTAGLLCPLPHVDTSPAIQGSITAQCY